MFQEQFYEGNAMLIWPLLGLLIFVAMFVGVLAFTWLGLRDRKTLDHIASLPLQADETSSDSIEKGQTP